MPVDAACCEPGITSGQDKFAPKYLVGNTLNAAPPGDPAANTAEPFRYFADPGDGTGIQAALAAAALSVGDVWIRPGTYALQAGAITGALTIPANVRVYGSGPGSTIITARTTGNQGVFSLAAGASLEELTVSAAAPADGVGAQRGLIAVAGDGALLRRLSLSIAATVASGLRSCISLQAGGGGTTRTTRIEDVDCAITGVGVAVGDPVSALEVVPAAGRCIAKITDFTSTGGDIAITDASAAGNGINQVIGERVTLDNWRFSAIRSTGVAEIETLRMTAAAPNAAAIAVSIASRPAVPPTALRNVWLDPATAIATGIAFTADVNGGVGLAPELDGLTYSGAATVTTLVSLAASAARGAAFRRVAATAGIGTTAILVSTGDPDAIVEDCTIEFTGTSGRSGVSLASTRARVKGNSIVTAASAAGGIGTCVLLNANATENIVSENNIVTANAADVGVDCTGNTNGSVTDNILDMATNANAVINVPASCVNADNNVI